MFTGIVEEIGKIESISQGKLTISAHKVLENVGLGDSIAVNGVCLTLINYTNYSFSVETMPETIKRTNLGRLTVGKRVNLERALLAGGRLGGHFVQGHIDGTGQVIALRPEGEALLVRCQAPAELSRYIVEKGFIAIDGVSLTVVHRDTNSFSVSIVSYSRQNTILGYLQTGDIVNLEVDILAKYVESINSNKVPGITMEFLAEHGF